MSKTRTIGLLVATLAMLGLCGLAFADLPAVTDGPVVNPANGNLYYLLEASTWTEAEAAAAALGGHLATVRNGDENAWLYSTFSDIDRGTNGYGGLWIGLNDAVDAGSFVWTSGAPLTYVNWAPGQPDVGNEHYVVIWGRAGQEGTWNNTLDDNWNNYGHDYPTYGVVEVVVTDCRQSAIHRMLKAVEDKRKKLQEIEALLADEAAAYADIEELLAGGDYGDLKKGEIIKAAQQLHSAMQHQRQAAEAIGKSIEKLQIALEALGWRAAPAPEPLEGLISWWRFEEAGGATAYDSIGQTNGVIIGAQWGQGQVGGALCFDGIDDYVSAGRIPALAVADNFTWSFWVWLAGANHRNEVMVGNRINDGESEFIKFTPSGLEYYIGNALKIVHDLQSQVWVNCTAVKAGAILTYYVNGESVGTATVVKDMPSVPLYFGGDPNTPYGSDEHSACALDEVMIFGRALSPEEVDLIYQLGYGQ